MVSLSEEQEIVHDGLVKWFLDCKKHRDYDKIKYVKTIGFAGTGKTTLIAKLKQTVLGLGFRDIAFCSFMGKAAAVLASKIDYDPKKDNNIYVGTLHGLMYKPKYAFNNATGKREIIGWEKKYKDEIGEYDLIVVDEASTIYPELMRDVVSFGIPVMFFGDPGQLPPISDTTQTSIALENPNFILKHIHRQALENPVIAMSKFVRENGYIPEGVYSKEVFKLSYKHPKCKEILDKLEMNEDTILLCGFNKTRCMMNNKMRSKLGFVNPEPYPTDRIICLRNNHTTKIMNGMLGTVVWVVHPVDDIYNLTIQMDGCEGFYSNYVFSHTFGKEQYDIDNTNYKELKKKLVKKVNDLETIDYFDFGYTITVHKSQGSEWDRVILFEERTLRWDDEFYKRWLYTAVTRTKSKLMVAYM
jgi:exodeoxyribonuclease-5